MIYAVATASTPHYVAFTPIHLQYLLLGHL
jgi:hypothetical protein